MMQISLYRILYTYRPSGFSLVETLVAVSILLLVVVGPLTITARTARSTTFASELATAQFLAQEGLELAQKARDDLLLQHNDSRRVRGDGTSAVTPWANFVDRSATGKYRLCYLDPVAGVGTGCGLAMSNTVDGELSTPVACSPNSATDQCKLKRSTNASDRARFNHSTGVDTPYTRTITFQESAPGQVRVVSVVTWRTGSLVANQRVQVETYLLNVYEDN